MPAWSRPHHDPPSTLRRPPSAFRLHACGTLGRHRDRRRSGGAVVAGRSGGAGGGPPDPVRQQPQADRPGLHSYHAALGSFPPGNLNYSAGRCPGMAEPTVSYSTWYGNWAIAILPYVEQAALFDRYDLQYANQSPENQVVRETAVAAYLCPSDSPAGLLAVPATGPASVVGAQYAPGSYRAVSGRSDDALNYLDSEMMFAYKQAVARTDPRNLRRRRLGDSRSNASATSRTERRTLCWSANRLPRPMPAIAPSGRIPMRITRCRPPRPKRGRCGAITTAAWRPAAAAPTTIPANAAGAASILKERISCSAMERSISWQTRSIWVYSAIWQPLTEEKSVLRRTTEGVIIMLRLLASTCLCFVTATCFSEDGIEGLPSPHYHRQATDPPWLTMRGSTSRPSRADAHVRRKNGNGRPARS